MLFYFAAQVSIIRQLQKSRSDTNPVALKRSDVVDGGSGLKDSHPWQQGLGEAKILIEPFTEGGDPSVLALCP